MQFDDHHALTSLDSLLQAMAIYIDNNVISFTFWFVMLMVFLNLNRCHALLDMTTHRSFGKLALAVSLGIAIILIKCVGSVTISCHVAGKGKWISCMLVYILHDGSSGNNTIASDKKWPAIQRNNN